ncbi:hypothetical protein [Paenibacillus wynnii]|uniref:hypothetical protein n=1 Tax=Paenibacillus wynnii TaxID=268407 RepID=UPI00278DC150|nr:hypothetical protein [Paenibacillus wynnii]MDQ0191886.1 hypothetical protein [Paenibacillus wynnii]
MKNKVLISFLILIAFFVGYLVRGFTNMNTSSHRWVLSSEPPSPGIKINGTVVPVFQGSYSWCNGTSLISQGCKSVDMIPFEEILKEKKAEPTVVSPNNLIETNAPKGIKEFTLTRRENKDNSDPYRTPSERGVYYYNIHCEWFADQGNAEFNFAVEVR